MAWATPIFDRTAVNRAGKGLLDTLPDIDLYFEALHVINNWRASHAFPLNTFQMNLRRKAKALDDDCLIAQRVKRLSSIQHKLDRFPNMKLSQMQDIGGCRAIVRDVETAEALVASFRASEIKHKPASYDNYIESPKESGYRGVHLVYRYYSDRKKTYNDLKIELQIRSQLQHAWATAVEVVGTLLRQALKSSQGEGDWLRFFQLMGSAIAIEESSPIVPNTPQNRRDLTTDIIRLVKSLRPAARLNHYKEMLKVIENSPRKAKYYLLDLRTSQKTVKITGFIESESIRASDAYLAIEKSLKPEEGDEAVLVSVDSIDALKRAYPNYFLDTDNFVKVITRWSKTTL